MVEYEESYPGGSYPAETWPGELQVTIDVDENYANSPAMTYRLRMSVTRAAHLDPNIFVFAAVPNVAGRDYDQVRFITVATAADMQELPIVEPVEGSEYRYRDSSLDLYFRTVTELDAARTSIVRRINSLLSDIESMVSMNNQMVINWTFDTDEDSSSVGG